MINCEIECGCDRIIQIEMIPFPFLFPFHSLSFEEKVKLQMHQISILGRKREEERRIGKGKAGISWAFLLILSNLFPFSFHHALTTLPSISRLLFFLWPTGHSIHFSSQFHYSFYSLFHHQLVFSHLKTSNELTWFSLSLLIVRTDHITSLFVPFFFPLRRNEKTIPIVLFDQSIIWQILTKTRA